MKSTKLLVVIALIITFFIPNTALARSYIGDELPVSNYQIGNGINIEEEVEIDQIMLPGLIPEELKEKCTWMQYPLSAFHFRSAPTEGAGWLQGKMSDVSSIVIDTIASLIFWIPKIITYFFNNILIICFDDFLLTDSLEIINKGVQSIAGPIIGKGEIGFSSILFTICMILLTIGVGITLLRAQIVKALTSVILSGVCIAVLLIYVANVQTILPPIFNFVNNVTGVAISSVAFIQDINSDSSNIPIEGNDLTTIQNALVEITNQAWFYLVSGPWSVGQFGTADYTKLKMTDEEKQRANEALKTSVLSRGGALIQGNTRKAFQRNETIKSEYLDTNFLASSEDFKDDFLTTITDPYIDHGQHQVTIAAASNGSASKHIFIAFIAIAPAFFYGLLLIFIGLPVLAAQFVIMGMLIFLPFALLLGVAGDSGRAVLIKYIETLVGYLAIKFIYGLYLGFAVFFAFSLAKSVSPHVGLSAFFICAIFITAILLREKFFKGCMNLISFMPGAVAGTAKVNGFIDKVFKGSMAWKLAKDTIRGRQVNKTRGSEPPKTNREKDTDKKDDGNNGQQDNTSTSVNERESNNSNQKPHVPNQKNSYYDTNNPVSKQDNNELNVYAYEKYPSQVPEDGKVNNDGYESQPTGNNPKPWSKESTVENQTKDNPIESSRELGRNNPVNIKPPWQKEKEAGNAPAKDIHRGGKQPEKKLKKPDVPKRFTQKPNTLQKGQGKINNFESTDNTRQTTLKPTIPTAVTGRPRLDDVNRYDDLYHRPVYGGREPYQGPYGRPRQVRKEDIRDRKMPPGAKWDD